MATRRKILSHTKLGIEFAELGALLGVLKMLETGVLGFAKPVKDKFDGLELPVTPSDKHLFNMATKVRSNECGTIGCIGGNMALILGKSPIGYVGEGGVLGPLFFPSGYEFSTVEPKQAIKAIYNFLATGKPKWEKILRKNQLNR